MVHAQPNDNQQWIELFLSVNGFIGGYLMLSDPNGAPIGMPVTDLARTPFQNFVIPGWILIGV